MFALFIVALKQIAIQAQFSHCSYLHLPVIILPKILLQVCAAI